MTLGAHTADFDLVLEGTDRRITDGDELPQYAATAI